MQTQTIHLQRIPYPSATWQSQLITLVERKTSGGLFVSPSTNPEPYREFHYYCDERNTLWADGRRLRGQRMNTREERLEE